MKIKNVVFITIYTVLLLLPAVAMPFFKNQANTENRTLASMPSITNEDGSFNSDYTSQLDDYIDDHIGFRNMLVSANTFLYTNVFKESPEDSIVMGQGDWLFYADTVKDYMNTASISQRNARNIARTMEMVQEYALDNGSQFVFSVIPNKSSLYGEYMPFYYAEGDDSTSGNIELLENALSGTNVNYVDMSRVFEAEDEILYQAGDSHWNYKGALLGYNSLMNAVDFPHNTFSDLTFTERKDWNSDLAVMLYGELGDNDKGLQLYPDYEFAYVITSHEKEVDSISLSMENPEGCGNAVVYRDSFCNTMQIYIAESFANSYFTRSYPYNMNYVTDKAADVTIIEIVERNIPNLAKKAPLMEAGTVNIPNSATQLHNGDYEIYSRETSGYIHYYGFIDEALLSDNYAVYVMLSDGNSYEAFPIYEQELLESDELCDNGFSIYIPADVATDKDVFVLVDTK